MVIGLPPTSTTVNSHALSGASTGDLLRFGICMIAGCPAGESTINYQTLFAGGSFSECAFNLATAATGSSVIVDVQNSAGTSVFGATKLVVATGTTAVTFQATFAASPQTFSRGDRYRAVVLQGDSNLIAQGGTVQCR